MKKIFQRVKQEFVNVIPAAIFFLVAFQLLALTRALVLQDFDIWISALVGTTFGALVVAKVVMVVDLLPFVNRFPDKPLIYNALWKTAIYMFGAFLVRYLEYLIPFLITHGDIAEANRRLLDEAVWTHFWIVQIWLFVLFLIYCILKELVRVLGRERVRSIFFGPRQLEAT